MGAVTSPYFAGEETKAPGLTTIGGELDRVSRLFLLLTIHRRGISPGAPSWERPLLHSAWQRGEGLGLCVPLGQWEVYADPRNPHPEDSIAWGLKHGKGLTPSWPGLAWPFW